MSPPGRPPRRPPEDPFRLACITTGIALVYLLAIWVLLTHIPLHHH